MQFSNGTEYISERKLRERLGGCFSGSSSPNDPRYAEAGFYPVQYVILLDFQKHDTANAYLYDNTVVMVPAIDIPLAEAIPQAREQVNDYRKNREFTYIPVSVNGKTVYFSMSETSQFNLSGAVDEPDDIEWIMADGTVETLTNKQIKTIASAVRLRKKQLFALQAGYSKQFSGVSSVSEVRAIMAQAKTAFESI